LAVVNGLKPDSDRMSASVRESWRSSSTTRTCVSLTLDELIEHSDQMVRSERLLYGAVHGPDRGGRPRLVDQVRIATAQDHRDGRARPLDREYGLHRPQAPEPQVQDRRHRLLVLQKGQSVIEARGLEHLEAARAQRIGERAE